jgi:hypothetical protein
MALDFFRFGSEQRRIILAVHIGKSTIDFVLVERKGGNNTVLSHGTEELLHFTPRQTLEKIFSVCERHAVPKELVATFDHSLFRAKILSFTMPAQASAHRITRSEASEIERDILVRAQKTFQKVVFQESGIRPQEFVSKTVRILDRRISGYPVASLEGFKRGELEFSVLGAFLLDNAASLLAQFSKAHHISRVQAIHLAEALEFYTRAPGREGVYICIEAEKTRIAVRYRGHFSFLGAIDMGSQHFAELFGDVLGMHTPSAQLMQRKYFEGSLSVDVQEKVHLFLLPEARKFGTLLKDTLQEATIALPEHVWIFGRGSALRNLEDLFSGDTLKNLPFSRRPKVAFLYPKDIGKGYFQKDMADPVYTELCFLTSFYTKE